MHNNNTEVDLMAPRPTAAARRALSKFKMASLRTELATCRSLLASAEQQAAARFRLRIRQIEAILGIDSDKPPPALPLEVFLIIGQYFKPGSRSLLNLLSANKDLYALLLPRHVETIRYPTLLDPKFATYRTKKIEYLGQHVKELVLKHPPPPRTTRTGQQPIGEQNEHYARQLATTIEELKLLFPAAKNTLRKLKVDMIVRHIPSTWIEGFPAYFVPQRFTALTELELWGTLQSLPEWLPDMCPNIRRLVIDMDHGPGANGLNLTLWTSIGDLAHLDELELRLDTDHRALAGLPGLLKKITKYYGTRFESFVALASAPEFRPFFVNLEWVEEPANQVAAEQQTDQLWRIVAKMTSVKQLNVPCVRSDLVRSVGFFNIEYLRLGDVKPMQHGTPALLKQLKTKAPTSLSGADIVPVISVFPEKGTAEYDNLLDELVWWNTAIDTENYPLHLGIGGDFALRDTRRGWIRQMRHDVESGSPEKLIVDWLARRKKSKVRAIMAGLVLAGPEEDESPE